MAKRYRSGIYQSVAYFENSKSNTGRGLLITARTGYVNVTINGQRFYYDERQKYNSLKQVNIPNIMLAQANRNNRGIIIISRKK